MSLLRGKMEAYFGIRLPAAQYHEIFSAKPHQVSNMAPTRIKNCATHEGDWGKKDTIVIWDYIHDGVHKIAKELIEDIDDVNLSTTFKVIEGDIMKDFKEFKITVQATPQTAETSLIHWTIEYERLSEDVPEPFSLLKLVVHLSKDIDDHHFNK